MIDILGALNEIRAFLDDHATAEHYEIGNGLIPNKAMLLIFTLDEVIEFLKTEFGLEEKTR